MQNICTQTVQSRSLSSFVEDKFCSVIRSARINNLSLLVKPQLQKKVTGKVVYVTHIYGEFLLR